VAAAAACVAIIFVGRSRQEQASAEAAQNAVAAKTAPAVTPRLATMDAKVTPIAIDTPQAQARAGGIVAASTLRQNESAQPSFVSTNALFLSQNTSANASVPANDQFAWLHTNLGLVSLDQQLQLEKMRFQTGSITLQPSAEAQRLGGRAPSNKNQPPATEMNAFQFSLGK
jgi:hypothetical protein